MKHTVQILCSGIVALSSTTALADPSSGWQDGYGHMMWGGGFGFFGGFMMLVFWGLVIALVVLAVRWFGSGNGPKSGNDAMDILRERLAKGEIDEEEFARRKKALES